MTSKLSEKTAGLPVLDTLKEHLPSTLLDQLRDFVSQLIASRRTLQAACENYRYERDTLRTALLETFRIDQEGPMVPFLQQAVELAARVGGADATALALETEPSEDGRAPLLVTRHCTEADEAFIRTELFAPSGVLRHARRADGPVTISALHDMPRRIGPALAARHVKTALALPFLTRADAPARGILYLEHMSRTEAFEARRPLLQACVEFVAMGVTTRERMQTVQRLADHTASLRAGGRYASLAGRSQAFAEALRRLEWLRLSRPGAPALFIGEPGTGKETLARTAHAQGERADGPFLTMDCAWITGPGQQAGRLFGSAAHPGEGATRGLLSAARGGTLYLQNVHALAPSVQRRLLRALDTRTLTDEKDGFPVPLDLQILASSPAPLPALAREQRFSTPLAERLSLFQIELPPLRERREDILPLAEHFLRTYASEQGRPGLTFSAASLRNLERREWSGNLDELRGCVTRAAERSSGRIVVIEAERSGPGPAQQTPTDWKQALSDFQRRLIADAMRETEGNVARAAERLNISRQYLNARLKALGLDTLRHGPR